MNLNIFCRPMYVNSWFLADGVNLDAVELWGWQA